MKIQKYVGQKWRLKFGLLVAGLTKRAEIVLVSPDDERALIFDSRDSQPRKLDFFSRSMGVPFEIEALA